MTSPAPNKKIVIPSETVLSLTDEKKVTSPPTSQPKTKRATSFKKKKTPPLKRGYSDNSKLKMNRSLGMFKLIKIKIYII
jgi:hypothetical protein